MQFLAGVVALAAVAACGGTDDGSSSEAALRLGVLTSEPGPARYGGLSAAQAVEQAVDDINAAGGVLGVDISVTIAYTGQEGERLTDAVDQLLGSEAVAAAVGPDNSIETEIVLERFVDAPAVLCGYSATADEFSDTDDDGFYVRTVPPDRHQGLILGRLVAEDGEEPVTILAQLGAYGEGLAAVVEEELRRQGIEFTTVLFDPRLRDPAPVQDELVATEPRTVLALTHVAPALGGLAQIGLGPADLPVFVSDGLSMDEIFQNIDPSDPSATEGMIGVKPGWAHDHPDPELVERATAGHVTGQAYDCAVLVALAAEAAGSAEAPAIRDELAAVSRDGEKCHTFAACRDLLAEGQDIDYDGVSGPIELDDAGDPSVAVYHVLEFGQDGRMDIIDRVTVTQ